MTLAIFLSILGIHFLAAMSPGPSFVVAVRTAARNGFRPASGLAISFGAGAVLWALTALCGVTLLFDVLPALYLAFKICGGLFLLWIGIQTVRHAGAELQTSPGLTTPTTFWGGIKLGLVTQMSNPKTAVFFGAVFAGLIPQETSVSTLAALLFFVFVNETLWYVFVAALLSRKKAQSMYARAKRSSDTLLGGLLAAFGIKIALG